MQPITLPAAARTILILGASRGLDHAMAEEFLKRNWSVAGTVRAGARTRLHDLVEQYAGHVEVETLDINDIEQLARLRSRMIGRVLGMLFVNAGTITHDEHVPIGDVTTEEFTRVMVTNALSPMRAVEGSITHTTTGCATFIEAARPP